MSEARSQTFISKSPEDTAAEAAKLARAIAGTQNPYDHAFVIALSGDLGSGKTTFMQAFCAALGITDVVTSPTFVIQKNYPLQNPFFAQCAHIDAYRLEHESELSRIGFAETAGDPRNIVCIEWPERVAGLLPKDRLTIAFRFIDETTREMITIYGR